MKEIKLREEKKFDKIIKQIPDNDKYYISYDPTSDSYYIKADKKVIVIPDDEEKPKKKKKKSDITNPDILTRVDRTNEVTKILRTLGEKTKRKIARN